MRLQDRGLYVRWSKKLKDLVIFLTPKLRSKNTKIRSVALEELWCLGKLAKSAIPEIKKLLDDPDKMIREDAANAIKDIEK